MNYLELFGTLVGLVYLWLEYRASIYLWLACIIMPAIYLVVYYQAGLYADFGINVYYLIASVYGWIVWSRGRKKHDAQQEEKGIPITRKYVEQWWAWMIVDWVCCALYIYKELYFTSALYGVYAIVAFFGWRKWLSLMRTGSRTENE